MKSGSKYYPLYQYLQAGQRQTDPSNAPLIQKNIKLTLTFSEIESILNTSLPPSARKRAWWSNRDSASALQAGAWVQAGYHVETVDFKKQTVTFKPFTAEYTVQRTDNAIVWDQQAIRALRKHMSLTQAKFATELGVRRQTVSEWEN
ncbi:MAG: helix-turn-helix transcriptional regulator, partial [Cyanobacteria bacterium J06555_13]